MASRRPLFLLALLVVSVEYQRGDQAKSAEITLG